MTRTIFAALFLGATFAHAQPATRPADALAFTVKDIDGRDVDLGQYRGKVVLIVNVASKCGFTKQYAGLEKLYEQYQDKGLVVLGFPANNFNGQEPGTDAQIKEFCTGTYDVKFPMMSKLSVKGDGKAPLYHYLTEPATAGEFAGEIGWNFTKFVIGRDGKITARFPSQTTPQDPKLIAALDAALAK
jgi:glutathione peroxidase